MHNVMVLRYVHKFLHTPHFKRQSIQTHLECEFVRSDVLLTNRTKYCVTLVISSQKALQHPFSLRSLIVENTRCCHEDTHLSRDTCCKELRPQLVKNSRTQTNSHGSKLGNESSRLLVLQMIAVLADILAIIPGRC